MEKNSPELINRAAEEQEALRASVKNHFCMNCVGALENKCPALMSEEIMDKQIIVEEDGSYTCASYRPIEFTFNEDQVTTDEQRELFKKYNIIFGKPYTIKEVFHLMVELEALAQREENPTILTPDMKPAE